MPMLSPANCTDSTATYPLVLDIDRDVVPLCVTVAASASSSTVLPSVVAPVTSNVLVRFVAPATSSVVPTVAAPLVSSVVDATLPSTVNVPDVSTIRSVSPLMPMLSPANCTDSTATYPLVLDIDRDVVPLCVTVAASASSSTVLPSVVAPVTSNVLVRFVAPATSSVVPTVAAPLVSSVVDATLPSTVNVPDVSTIRSVSPLMPMLSPANCTDSTATYPLVLDIDRDVVPLCVTVAASASSSTVLPSVVAPVTSNVLVRFVAPATSSVVPTVAAPLVSSVVDATLPSTVNVPDVSTIRSVSPLMPMLSPANCTDSTATYPLVLDIDRDVVPLCVTVAASASSSTVLPSVVAPVTSNVLVRFVAPATSSVVPTVAAPLVSSVVDATLPSTVNVPDVSTIRSVSPLMPMLSPANCTDSTATYPLVLDIDRDVVPLCVTVAASASSSTVLPSVVAPVTSNVLVRFVAPATSSVVPTVAAPLVSSVVDATLPSTVNVPDVSTIRSVSPLMPMLSPANCTDSTATYPLVLDIDRDVVPLCVTVAASASSSTVLPSVVAPVTSNVLVRFVAPATSSVVPTVAAPLVSSVVDATLPSTVNVPDVSTIRSVSPLMPMLSPANCTDSTATYPLVLDIDRDVVPLCVTVAASASSSTVLPSVVAPVTSNVLVRFVAPATSSVVPTVAAPLVSSVVDATLPSTVNVPDVSTIRSVSPLMPMLSPANCTDSTATYPLVLDIDRDVVPLCVTVAASASSSTVLPSVVAPVTSNVLVRFVAPATSSVVPTVAAPLVSSVVDATLPSTVNVPDVSTIRSVSPLMPMLSPANCTDSTATYPLVLDIDRDVVPLCVTVAASASSSTVLPSVVAPVTSNVLVRFVAPATSSVVPTVAAPLVSSVVDATLPSTVNVPDVSTIRSVSPLMPMLSPANCTDSTATYPLVLDIDRDVVPLCVTVAASASSSTVLPSVVAPVTSNVLVRFVAPATSSVVPTVAAPLVSSVVDATLPSTVNVPDVSTIRSVSPLMPMLSPANCTDSTATYPPVLDIDRDPLPVCKICTAVVFDSVRSPPTSSVVPTVAAPLVSSVVDATLPSTVNVPDVSTIRFGSPFIPICDPVNRTDSTSTVPSERMRTCSTAAVEPLVVPRVPNTKSPLVSPAALVCSYAITAGGLCWAAFPTYPNPMS